MTSLYPNVLFIPLNSATVSDSTIKYAKWWPSYQSSNFTPHIIYTCLKGLTKRASCTITTIPFYFTGLPGGCKIDNEIMPTQRFKPLFTQRLCKQLKLCWTTRWAEFDLVLERKTLKEDYHHKELQHNPSERRDMHECIFLEFSWQISSISSTLTIWWCTFAKQNSHTPWTFLHFVILQSQTLRYFIQILWSKNCFQKSCN